ncbi:MAG: response regulator transcription factor [Muribaculaceae bacterium]|nr:response regulator transcription factor [Muribaculaceae bacterium]
MLTDGNKNSLASHAAGKILVIDDEQLICELIQYNLENEGYRVDICQSAEEALKYNLADYRLLIVDVMMGEMNGIKFAHIVKQNPDTAHIPIIFCSAKDNEDDIVNGLNSGADDYILKPFSLREMIARVRSVLRRNSVEIPKAVCTHLEFKGLHADLASQVITNAGVPLTLTRTEYQILVLFMKHVNRLFNRAEIFEHVWPEQVVVSERTVDVNISRIRKKIGEYAKYIVNRSGFGYGLME